MGCLPRERGLNGRDVRGCGGRCRALEGAELLKTGAPVAVTHLARTLHPSQAALEAYEAASPAPLIIAHDGLTLEL